MHIYKAHKNKNENALCHCSIRGVVRQVLRYADGRCLRAVYVVLLLVSS